MSKIAITSPELSPPVGPFSQAIKIGGFIYFSGQVGQDPTTGKLVPGHTIPIRSNRELAQLFVQ